MKIFGKILLLITGILFFLVGVISFIVSIVSLVRFEYPSIASNISGFANIIVTFILSIIFFFGGLAGIIVFFHLNASTAARVQKYAIIILGITIISLLVQIVLMIVDVSKGGAVENIDWVIGSMAINLVLPILYYLGAYLSKRVIERK